MSEFGTCPRCGGTTMDYHCGPCLAEANERLRTQVAALQVLPELELLLAFCEFACYAESPLLPLLPVPRKRDEIIHAFLTTRASSPPAQLASLTNELRAAGHTYHCAARQTWGDGACECDGQQQSPGPRVPGGL